MAIRKPPYFHPIRLDAVEVEIEKIDKLNQDDFEIFECYCAQQILSEIKTLTDAQEALVPYLKNPDELTVDDYNLIENYVNIADTLIDAYNAEWVRRQNY